MLKGPCGHPRLAWLALVWVAAAAPSFSSPVSPADPAQRLRDILLGSPGQAIVCPGCPDEPAIRVDSSTGQSTEVPLPYERVNDVVTFPGGDRVLAATSSEKGKRSQLLVLSAESLAPLGRVEIPGNGVRLAVAPDGYAAFIISHRPARSATDAQAGDWELLAIDLGKSQVASSYPLPGAAYDLALSEDGTRLFVGLEGKIQSFTTSPLTASWFFRSPGKNLRVRVRPRQGQVYALRDSHIAVFPSEPRKPAEGEEPSKEDDASTLLDSPAHVDRFGFSRDGRIAVAAGRGMDVLVIVDAVHAKIAGSWPEEESAVRTLLAEADAAERPKGPRGKLVAQEKSYAPPLGGGPADAGSSPTHGAPDASGSSASDPVKIAQIATPFSSSAQPHGITDPRAGGTAPSASAPPSASSSTSVAPVPPEHPPAHESVKGPQASPPGMAPPRPEKMTDEPRTVPDPQAAPPRQIPPEQASLEEVEGAQIKGRIGGEFSSVAWVVLFGPDNIMKEKDRVQPGPDGSFSFNLPPKGKYRIVLVPRPGLTLATRPSFHTLTIEEYGFSGVDFSVLKTVTAVPH